jgi:hypothetical protein
MFQQDPWLGERPLQDVYPSLILIFSEPTLLVTTVAHGGHGTLCSVEPLARMRPHHGVSLGLVSPFSLSYRG